MKYVSTRSAERKVDAAQAIVAGLSHEGGLYVPESFPAFAPGRIEKMANLPYAARAKEVLGAYLTDYTQEELEQCVREAYAAERFGSDPAPVVPVMGMHVLELWHGPTHAFKDMALQMLPRLMTRAMKKTGVDKEVLILVATSGDTGKAALEGFCDVEGTQVGVFYPVDGVSPAQKLQMVTQEGNNVHVCAVEGNFDDAQTGVKRIFGDEAFARELAGKGVALSSANSINWGRLVPQVAYYFSAYADLIKTGAISMGQEVNFCVPTGNFGNILAAYYAKRMGLPVGRLICASNENNVLYDFIRQGVYDANRPFHKTTSPSMDILISSNLERLLFELCGRDTPRVRAWMGALKSGGVYDVGEETRAALADSFDAGWADDRKALQAIARVQRACGYTMDPHTAVAWEVAEEYRARTGDGRPMVVVSTASPYKFSRSVLGALKGEDAVRGLDEFACADELERVCGLAMPESLRALRTKARRHQDVARPQDMADEVRRWVK
ncbi:MAG: threonine synthase [Candidatus Spyradocola sp.]|jgi:threonine synthase